MRGRSRVGWGLLMVLVLLSGCVDGVHDDDSMVAAAWALAAEPDFLVPGGVAHGDSIHFFGISNGEFAHDGNAIVTLGRGANTLVVIGGDGQVVEVLGGSGDGPQEFRGLPWLLRVGEGLIAVDRAGRRYFELVGLELGEAVSYERGPAERVVAVLADGTIVTTQVRPPTPQRYTDGLPVTPYYLRAGGAVATLAGPSSPPEPAFLLTAPSTGNLSVASATDCLPANHYAALDELLLITDASTGLVLTLDHTDRVDTLYQSRIARGVVTREMVDGVRRYGDELEAAGMPVQRDVFLGGVGQVGDSLRAVWNDMLWDGRSLWLRRAVPCLFGEGTRTEPYIWDVIDTESRSRLAVVETPADLRVLAVAPDGRVLGVVRDELGVQYVGVYRTLDKGQDR